MTDADNDGLADECETMLAAAFNPELRYSSHDEVWGGEPVWVAKAQLVFNQSVGFQNVVRIMYMPAYYNDLGNPYDCWKGFWDYFVHFLGWGDCAGHYGDSEAILLDVRYEPGSQHWILNSAYLSQHTGYQWFNAGNTGSYGENDDLYSEAYGNVKTPGTYPTALSYYNGKPGGAPIIWVSIDKHANYANERDCNNGGGFAGIGKDDCQMNDSFMFMALSDGMVGQRNLGSSTTKFISCLESNNPATHQISPPGPPWHQECFWDPNYTFSGWSGANPSSTPYGNRLVRWRF